MKISGFANFHTGSSSRKSERLGIVSPQNIFTKNEQPGPTKKAIRYSPSYRADYSELLVLIKAAGADTDKKEIRRLILSYFFAGRIGEIETVLQAVNEIITEIKIRYGSLEVLSQKTPEESARFLEERFPGICQLIQQTGATSFPDPSENLTTKSPCMGVYTPEQLTDLLYRFRKASEEYDSSDPVGIGLFYTREDTQPPVWIGYDRTQKEWIFFSLDRIVPERFFGERSLTEAIFRILGSKQAERILLQLEPIGSRNSGTFFQAMDRFQNIPREIRNPPFTSQTAAFEQNGLTPLLLSVSGSNPERTEELLDLYEKHSLVYDPVIWQRARELQNSQVLDSFYKRNPTPFLRPEQRDSMPLKESFGYPGNRGDCFGMSMKGIEAFLNDDLPTFRKRFSHMKTLIHRIEREGNILPLPPEKESLLKTAAESVSEGLYNDLRAFFDGVGIYQNANQYKELFPEEKQSVLSFQTGISSLTAPVVQSLEIEQKGGMVESKTFYFLGTEEELLTLCLSWERLLQEQENPPRIGWEIVGGNHAVFFGIDPEKTTPVFFDANQTEDPDPESISEAARKIFFSTYGKTGKPHCLTLTAYTTGDALSSANTLLSSWEQTETVRKVLTINREKALSITESLHGSYHSLLKEAFSHNDIRLIEKLIDLYPELLDRDIGGFTPLQIAICNGFRKFIEYFLEKGSDIHQTSLEGITGFGYAIQFRDPSIVRLLIQSGADVNQPDTKGRTPVMYAAHGRDETIFSLLLENGADINAADSQGVTPLMIAAAEENEILVKRLLSEGACVNASTTRGLTPLMLATNYGHEDIVTLLVENGADVNRSNTKGWTPLMLAAKARKPEIVRYLLAKGARIDATDALGYTPLMIATQNGHDEIVKILLDSGAEIESSNIEGTNAFSLAMKYRNLSSARILFEQKIKAIFSRNILSFQEQ